jgi:DNA helicase II / ATP-dependent DNA helicase PcrA
MMSDPALAVDVGGRFDHVLVDEYQDTNRLQSSILLGLKPTGQGLTVVGDDAQSILFPRRDGTEHPGLPGSI